MRCTNKNETTEVRREHSREHRVPIEPKRKNHQLAYIRLLACALFVIVVLLAGSCYIVFVKNEKVDLDRAYTRSDSAFGIEKTISLASGKGNSFSSDLCVTAGDTNTDLLSLNCGAGGVFDLSSKKVAFSTNIFQKMYPASVTKVMTALVTMKNCNLDEVVTIGDECKDIETGSSVCMIEPGDQLTVEQLLYGLLLNSGNDAAMSLAVYVGGSVDEFVAMMNAEASDLGMTGSHFMNPHGLQDTNHYTTVYDIYLMFQEALKYDIFQTIIGETNYYAVFTRDAEDYGIMWETTNYYHLSEATPPDNVSIIGGKTGTTDEAGCNLVLYSKNKYGDPFVTVVLKAEDKETLYSEMNKELSIINN